jgi:hypothetical protein
MEKSIIRPVKQNKSNGQRIVSVGKIAKEGDYVLIQKLNIEASVIPQRTPEAPAIKPDV